MDLDLDPQEKVSKTFGNSAFVGRSDEMEFLFEELAEVRETGARTIFISGEAGVGKTRLVNEFKRPALEEGFEFLSGTCLKETADPYLPFKEAFDEYLKRDEKGLRDELQVAFLGVEDDKSISDKEMFEAEMEATFYETTEYVKEIAEREPLLIFLDDIQWVDQASIQILNYMTYKLKSATVLFVCTYRPEDMKEKKAVKKTIQEMNTRYSNVSEIELSPLDEESTEKMIKEQLRVEEVPEDFVSLIHEKTDGNPLFAEECVKHMLENEQVKPEEEIYPKEGEVISVPDMVEDVLERRLGRLSGETKKILDIGSVIGEFIDFSVLEEVVDMESFELLDHMDELLAASIWRETAGEEVIHFHHALMRDTIYSSMVDTKKRLLHNRTGEAVEKIYSENIEDFYPRLAHHYENGKKYGKSFDYYSKAGEKAKDIYAHRDAVKMYDKALDMAKKMEDEGKIVEVKEELAETFTTLGEYDRALNEYEDFLEMVEGPKKKAEVLSKMAKVQEKEGEYDRSLESCEKGLSLVDEDTRERLELLGAKGWACLRKGEYEGAEDAWKEGMKIAEKIGVEKEVAQAHHDLGSLYFRQGKYDKALNLMEKALELREDIGDDKGIADTLNNIAVVYDDKRELDKALDYYEKSLKIEKKIGDKRGIAMSFNNIAVVYWNKGEMDKALEHYEKSLQITRKIGDKWGVGQSLNNIAGVYWSKGKLDKVLEYCEKSLEIRREIGDKQGIARSLNNVGETYYNKGKLDKALEHYEKSLEISRNIGDTPGIAMSLNNLAQVYRRMGRTDEAMKKLDESLNICSEIGNKQQLVENKLELSDICREEGRYDQALQRAKKALELSHETGAKEEEGMSRLVLGKICRRRGELEKAEEELERAEDIFKETGISIEIPKVEFEQGILYREKGELEEGEKRISKALKSFEERGMEHWVEKCKEVL
ncbi:MAG: tetratricopeptide repeat protein [Candidatus Aenigmatarchaeota archaeon]